MLIGGKWDLTGHSLSSHSLFPSPTYNSLQTFLLDGNFLQSLPDELEHMRQLSYMSLSFNEFTDIPGVLEKLTAMDKLCMSGNCMDTLNLQVLKRMPHIKHVDLRYLRKGKNK